MTLMSCYLFGESPKAIKDCIWQRISFLRVIMVILKEIMIAPQLIRSHKLLKMGTTQQKHNTQSVGADKKFRRNVYGLKRRKTKEIRI